MLKKILKKPQSAGKLLAGRILAASGKGDKNMLGYWPNVSDNPYLSLLYSGAAEAGHVVFEAPEPGFAIFDALGRPAVAHLHWIHRVLVDKSSFRSARRAITPFIDRLKALQDEGHKILWTVHNSLSHDALYPDEEALLRSKLAALVDAIHIMNPDTPALVRPLYTLPENKIFHVPHPSYQGVYSQFQSRDWARMKLGLGPDDKMLLHFGGIQERKGVLRLIDQVTDTIAAGHADIYLFVVGRCPDKVLAAKIKQKVSAVPHIRWRRGFTPDFLIETFMRAADLVVCPYRDGLNSGVAALAATYGRPMVLPQQFRGKFSDYSATRYFDPDDDTSLADAWRSALATPMPQTQDITHWAQKYAPHTVSSRFFERMGAALS